MKGLNTMTNETFEFTMKDASGSFGWLLEGSTDLRDVEATDVKTWVEATAKMMISGANYSDTSDGAVYQSWIDDTYEFDEVVAFLQSKIEEAKDEQTLEAVVTPKEVAEEFGVKEDTVRDAIEHGWLIARKSGATWLILRKHAEKRWAKK
jgi:hypothetical protein